MIRLILTAAVVVAAGYAFAGTPPGAGVGVRSATPVLALRDHPSWPSPAPDDAASINALVAAFATTLSAPAGGRLDRLRLRSLFLPGGRIVIGVAPRPGRPADVAFVTPDEYADLSDRQTLRVGFFDNVVANGVERFGDMAHVYSTYESRHAVSDPEPFARGIKSFDLIISQGHWRIVQVFYEHERPDAQIPRAWLKNRVD